MIGWFLEEELAAEPELMDIPVEEEEVVENKMSSTFPAIWSEEGKYLANVLGDALVKGLTLVSQHRPDDPVEYLANFLRGYNGGGDWNEQAIAAAAVAAVGIPVLVPDDDLEDANEVEEVVDQEPAEPEAPPETEPEAEAPPEIEPEAEAPPETEPEEADEPVADDEPAAAEQHSESTLNTEISNAYDKLEESLEDEATTAGGPFDPEKEELEESQLEESSKLIGGEDSDNALSTPLASSTRDENGSSVLHFASTRPGGASTIMAFLQNPSVSLGWRDVNLRTARDVAVNLNRSENAKVIDNWVVGLAYRGELEVLEGLLVDGYDHLVDVEDSSGVHIVEVAEGEGKREVALLLRGVPEFREKVERVHRCVRSGDFDGVKSLVGGDRKLAVAMNPKTGRSAIHVAVLCEEVPVVRWLSENVPECLKKGDNLERTCLHYAMGVDKVEKIVRILVRAGAKRVVKDLRDRQPSWYFINRDEIGELQAEERSILN